MFSFSVSLSSSPHPITTIKEGSLPSTGLHLGVAVLTFLLFLGPLNSPGSQVMLQGN